MMPMTRPVTQTQAVKHSATAPLISAGGLRGAYGKAELQGVDLGELELVYDVVMSHIQGCVSAAAWHDTSGVRRIAVCDCMFDVRGLVDRVEVVKRQQAAEGRSRMTQPRAYSQRLNALDLRGNSAIDKFATVHAAIEGGVERLSCVQAMCQSGSDMEQNSAKWRFPRH